MLEGWRQKDPPITKKLPIEVDIPEYISRCARGVAATPQDHAVGDLVLIAFYYLLRVGEYTIKGSNNSTKRTVQFKMNDVTFFWKDPTGTLRQLSRSAPDADIMSAHSATLKLDNQKNGWKGDCIHQEHNGETVHCPVRALGRRYVHIRVHTTDSTAPISTYFLAHKRCTITDANIRACLKHAAAALDYPSKKGIPIDRIDTHSLRSGGANALALSGFSDREIQKMGRWRSATFKEYIREELSCYAHGMSRKMKRNFGFVNIAGGVYHDVTPTTIVTPYNSTAVAA